MGWSKVEMGKEEGGKHGIINRHSNSFRKNNHTHTFALVFSQKQQASLDGRQRSTWHHDFGLEHSIVSLYLKRGENRIETKKSSCPRTAHTTSTPPRILYTSACDLPLHCIGATLYVQCNQFFLRRRRGKGWKIEKNNKYRRVIGI